MTREINTKFWIGDGVWGVLRNSGDWVVNADKTATIVKLVVFSPGGLYYELYHGDYKWEESDLFATQEEAQAECNRRNRELEK